MTDARRRVPSPLVGEGAPRGARSKEDAYILEEQIGHLFRRAHQRATAIFMAKLGDRFQITPTQYAALVKLHDLGAQSQNRLGRLTAMDPATIQGVIRRLEERALIERTGDPGDRRRARLRLSRAGEELVAAMIGHGRRVSEMTLAPLDRAEQARFLAFLRRLV